MSKANLLIQVVKGLVALFILAVIVTVIAKLFKRKAASAPANIPSLYNCTVGSGAGANWLPMLQRKYQARCQPIPEATPFYNKGSYFCDLYDDNNKLIKSGQPTSGDMVKCNLN